MKIKMKIKSKYYIKFLMLFAMLLSMLLAYTGTAHADNHSKQYTNGTSALHAFMTGTHALEADFRQTVYDRHQHIRQQESGTMTFSRPGKFRWIYLPPEAQQIVGDGQKIWLYDEGLAQVTVKNLNHALGSSPAALLAGDNSIERYYRLADAGAHDSLLWVTATPKSTDGSWKQIEMGFEQDKLRQLIMHDNFGMTTVLQFSHLKRNPVLPADTFHFTPPEGVDVLSDQP